jgi:hypothetical protein
MQNPRGIGQFALEVSIFYRVISANRCPFKAARKKRDTAGAGRREVEGGGGEQPG